MTRTSGYLTALAVGTVLIIAATTAHAFPDKPITMLIGAGAGGSTDAGGGILAQTMEK